MLFYLSINNLLYLIKRHRLEVVVVHTNIVLGRIKILKPFGINSRVVLSGVDVAKELPYIFITTFKTQEGIVAEIYLLFVHCDKHLQGNMFKPLDKTLSDILQVVVAQNQIYLSVQTVK